MTTQSTPSQPLVLATTNAHKAGEMAQMLVGLGTELKTLRDFTTALEVEEVGHSFAENAACKAAQQARHLGQWALAEDSGLVVDVLDGAPGIYSARYAGIKATDLENNERLLDNLADTPTVERAAHYVCHLALADPTGQIRAASEAACHGRIGYQARGNFGFGYDPLFEIVEYHQTFGQLGPLVKAVISHRARAMRQLWSQIEQLVQQGQWQ